MKGRGQWGRPAEDHQTKLEEEVPGKGGRSPAGVTGPQRSNPG